MNRETKLPGIRQFDLSGKSAIVTGGSKGLGEAISAGLASAGARVLLTSRHGEEAEQVARRIAEDFGVECRSGQRHPNLR